MKPSSKKDRIVSFDEVLVVEVSASAHDGKANVALVKFLSRELKHQVRMSGLKSPKRN